MKILIILLAVIAGGLYARYYPKQEGPVLDTSFGQSLESPNKDTIDRLTRLLQAKGSPLSVYAADFVKEADAYRIDPAIVVGISGAESSFGKRYVPNTFNPFGFGHCDSCASGKHFESIPQAIRHVTKTIATGKHYRTFQKTKECKDLARIYLTGDRERWCRTIASVAEALK